MTDQELIAPELPEQKDPTISGHKSGWYKVARSEDIASMKSERELESVGTTTIPRLDSNASGIVLIVFLTKDDLKFSSNENNSVANGIIDSTREMQINGSNHIF